MSKEIQKIYDKFMKTIIYTYVYSDYQGGMRYFKDALQKTHMCSIMSLCKKILESKIGIKPSKTNDINQ